MKRKVESKYWRSSPDPSSKPSSSSSFSAATSASLKKSKVTEKVLAITKRDENFPTGRDEQMIQPTASSSNSKQKMLTRSFFDVPGSDLARKLLGQRLVRLQGSHRISGRIVETEAYLGLEDKAAHSYQGKRTARNEAMFMEPGTAYVYNIYGMYCCLNISSKGDGAAVLIRALEAVEGQDMMRKARKKGKSTKTLKDKELVNGPSKLCQALDISKDEFNQIDITSSGTLWLEEDKLIEESNIVTSARINIGYAEDWKDRPLRFYILGNTSVSVRDKKAEEEIQQNLPGHKT